MLKVSGVSKAFGGVKAVNVMSLEVNRGEIVSLIGPNGAGKTTLFNLVSGFYSPDGGEIHFHDNRIHGLPPNRVMAKGIARTFQSLRLFSEMTVLENVLVSQHYRHGSGWVGSTFGLPRNRKSEREMRERALEALSFFGPRLMGFRLDQPVRALSYANRRRVEMARAMATGAELLLLDEPSAGMNPKETEEISEIILRMRDEAGYSILLVEHKMKLVRRVSDRVVAMDSGGKIAEGSYPQVANDPAVIEAYLGRPRSAAAGGGAGDR